MARKKLIVFVDRGDIVRSPVAAFLTNREIQYYGLSSKYEAISRRIQGVSPDDPIPPLHDNYYEYTPSAKGILEIKKRTLYKSEWEWYQIYQYIGAQQWVDDKVALWLIDRGIDLTDHKSTPVDPEIVKQAAIIFALDEKIQRGLMNLYPQESRRIFLLSNIFGRYEDSHDPQNAHEDDQLLILHMLRKTISDGFHSMIQMTDEVYGRQRGVYLQETERGRSLGPERF